MIWPKSPKAAWTRESTERFSTQILKISESIAKFVSEIHRFLLLTSSYSCLQLSLIGLLPQSCDTNSVSNVIVPAFQAEKSRTQWCKAEGIRFRYRVIQGNTFALLCWRGFQAIIHEGLAACGLSTARPSKKLVFITELPFWCTICGHTHVQHWRFCSSRLPEASQFCQEFVTFCFKLLSVFSEMRSARSKWNIRHRLHNDSKRVLPCASQVQRTAPTLKCSKPFGRKLC